MEKQVRIFVGITIGMILIIALVFYGVYENKEAVKAKIEVIEPDNALLLAAKDRSEATIDTLEALYPANTNNTFVRFTFGKPGEEGIHIWAKVSELATDHVTIDLTTVDKGLRLPIQGKEMQLSIDQIEDWIIDLPNGKIRGGFTTQALLISKMNAEVAAKDSIQQQLQQFSDPLL